MTTTISERFVLLFNSTMGRVIRISIPRACANKNATEVQAAMNAMVSGNTVSVAGKGGLSSPNKAKRVVTQSRRVL